MRTVWIAIAAGALLAAGAGAQEPAKPKPLPDGVAAVVRGDVVSMDEFRDALVARFGGTPEGQQVLDNLVTDLAVEAERERLGIEVTDAELDAYIAGVEKQVERASAGTKTLDQFLAEQQTSREKFRELSRKFLVRQRLAGKALGTSDEVRPADLKMWLDSLREKAGIVLDPEKLPAGAYARVGDRTIGALEFGKELLRSLPGDRLESALWDVAISRAVRQELKEKGVELGPEDVDRAVDELRAEFGKDPRLAEGGVTFEKAIEQMRHMTVDELKRDPVFLAQVGIDKMIRAGLTKEDVRKYWEEHSDRYGEARTFLQLLIRGDDDGPSPFGKVTRPMADARKKIEAILERYRQGEPFEKLVKEESEARSEKVKPEQEIEVTRETPMPRALSVAVFEAPVGEVVGPIRTSFGYTLVKVLDVRPAPTFEEIYPRVRKDLVREARSRELLRIRQDPDIRLRY